MLKPFLLTIALLSIQTLLAVESDPYSIRKNDSLPTPTSSKLNIPIILPESATNIIFHTSPLDSLDLPIIEESRYIFDDFPEEYELWNESLVNPYGVRLVDMTERVKIDMRGYVPPTLKYVTSHFGYRKGQFHYGIDLKVHKGDSIFCAFAGQVRLTKYQRKGYGYYVVVRHQNGLETLYAHLEKTFVTPGQTVSAGQALGLGGNTGRSTGYHLHFETRYLGNAIDPNDLIDFDECVVKNDIFLLSAANFEYVKEIEKIRYWTVRQGDTLGKIASKTGISISRLCTLNNIKQTSVLRIGQKIRYT